MDLFKVTFLLGALVCTASSTEVDGYTETEGAAFATVNQEYKGATLAECAANCEADAPITCKSFMYSEKTEECSLTAVNSKTEAFERKLGITSYQRNVYLRECVTGVGKDYRGTKAETKSGKTCQKWAVNVPHKPAEKYTPENNAAGDLESNYCRNHDGESEAPWCYTTDTNTVWEHCHLPNCTEECKHCTGENYRGTQSITENGYTCQRWTSQTPHNHYYNPDAYPHWHLEENYCRNPGGEEPRPWCYTTDPNNSWDYCPIPTCTPEIRPPNFVPETNCTTGLGKLYRGTIAVTESGKTCQSWSAQSPHYHKYKPESYTCAGLDNNYCRNPDGSEKPWCYTTDSETRWEYCSVPKCNDSVTPLVEDDCYEGDGSSYHGLMSETIGGRTCQNWNSMAPHKHNLALESYPKADLSKNLCRNPDGDTAPWCYTTDPKVLWEYCNLKRCPSNPSGGPTQAGTDCKAGNVGAYQGSTSVTARGVTCQAWSSQSPHPHNNFNPQSHPTKGLDGNSCRNPDDDVNGPWCYTTDPKRRWDYCQIPDCAELKCGTPFKKPNLCKWRVVGGCASSANSWPWQVSLRGQGGASHFCGGTLINSQWVVSAAHCLRTSSPSDFKVLLGAHTKWGNERSRQMRNVEKLFLAPGRADIALVKLERPAQLNDRVLPACMPEKDYIVPNGSKCFATGWGSTQGSGDESILKQAAVLVYENEVCNSPPINYGLGDHMMCAERLEGGAGICFGDSGGPLVCKSQDGYVLQGVANWVVGCTFKPAGYARVSHYIDWIESTIRDN